MKTQSLTTQYQQLRWLVEQAEKFNVDQLELRAHWARYLCVLSAGFIENALKDVYAKYARSRSQPAIADFVEATLRRIQNPKASRFLETAAAFNKDWEDDLRNYLEDEGRKEAVDAIMSNRHLIAHGKDSGITLARLVEYLSKSVQVIEYIEEQCGI